MIALASVAFGYNMLKIGSLLFPFLLILLLFGISMGIFISAIIFRLGPSAEWLGWPIPMVLSIFAGVYYPISTLPSSLQIIAKAIPPSYVFEGCRAVLATGSLPAGYAFDLTAGALLSAAYLIATSFLFVKVYEENLEKGGVSRFQAEAL